MKEIRKIIFATDFSDVSQDALETAQTLQKATGAELEVIHVFDPTAFEMPAPYHFMPGVENWLDEHFRGMRERGQKALAELCPKLGNCPGVFIEGRPGVKIVEHADNNGADLLILGTHGHKGWNRLVLGSVAEYVVRHAKCPVLTVKPMESK